MKRVLWLLTILVIVFSTTVFANDITFIVNDEIIKNDYTIIERDDVLYVSISELAKSFGEEVYWDEETKEATVDFGNFNLVFGVGTETYQYYDMKLPLAYPTFTEEGKLYAPLSDYKWWFDANFVIDDALLAVRMDSDSFIKSEKDLLAYSYTEEDLLWLARIIDVETGSGSLDKRIAVANVVLNRVKSPLFPNTVEEVIFQSGQFPPAHKDGFTTLTPKLSSLIAAKRALNGENNVETCLYFNLVPFKGKSDDFYQLIEGDYFYY